MRSRPVCPAPPLASSPADASMLSRSREAAQSGSCQACGGGASGQLLLLSPPPPRRNVPADSSSCASPIPPPPDAARIFFRCVLVHRRLYVLGHRRFAIQPPPDAARIYVLGHRRFAALPERASCVRKAAFMMLKSDYVACACLVHLCLASRHTALCFAHPCSEIFLHSTHKHVLRNCMFQKHSVIKSSVRSMKDGTT